MLASINVLNGIAKISNSDIKISRKLSSQFKDRTGIEQKIALYEEGIINGKKEEKESLNTQNDKKNDETVQEDRLRREEERLAKLRQEEAEKERKRLEEEKAKKAKDAENEKNKEERERWKQGVKFSFDYKFYVSEVKGNVVTDPVTGLIEDVKTHEKYGQTQISLMPYMKSEDNGEIVSSFSYDKKDEYIDKSLSEDGNFRFNYLSVMLMGDKQKLTFRAGDTKVESSKVILNKNYRGYYGSVQYYLNGNPDKWEYKEKIKTGEIKDNGEQSLKISVLSAPDKGTLGVREEDQCNTNAFLFDFIKEKDGLLHAGYIFGEASRDEKKNTAQELIFELSDKSKVEVKGIDTAAEEHTLRMSYSVSERYVDDKRETKGDKFDISSYGKITYNKDFTSLYSRYNFVNKDFDVDLLSEKYGDRNIPTYVNEKTASGQYGYELKLSNTMMSKKITNDAEYYNYWKNAADKNYRKTGYLLSNKIKLNQRLTLYDSYKNIRDIDEKEDEVNLGILSAYDYIAGNKFQLTGSINSDFRMSRYFYLDDETYRETRNGIKENGLLILKSFKIWDRQNIDINNYSYKYSKENMFNIKKADSIFFDGSEVGALRGNAMLSLYDNEIVKSEYLALGYGYSQGLLIDDMFYKVMNDKKQARGNISLKGYSFDEKYDKNKTADVSGNDIGIYLPLEIRGVHSVNNLKLMNNIDNLSKEENSNIIFTSKNEKGLNSKLSLYADYTYEKKKYDFLDAEIINRLKMMREGVVNKEHNETLAFLNQNLAGIFEKIKIGNYERHELESGIKYKLIEGKGKLHLSAVFGGAYEFTDYFKTGKIFRNIGMALGGEMKYNFDKKLSLIETFKWKPYFAIGTGEYVKDIINNTAGLYYVSERSKAGIETVYKKEEYKDNANEIYNIEEIKLEIKGDAATKDYKTNLQYSFLYDSSKEFQIKREESLSADVILKGNIYTKEIQKDYENEKKNKGIISRSDLLTEFEGIKNDNRKGKSSLVSLRTSGSIEMFDGWNRFETGGSLLKRKSVEKRKEEESAEIFAGDMQKITETINLDSNVSYSANIGGEGEESDFRILKTGINLNVSEIIIKNITMSANFTRELYMHTKEFEIYDKSINIGSLTVRIAF